MHKKVMMEQSYWVSSCWYSLSPCSYFLLVFFYRLLQVSLSVSATEVRAHCHERVHCGWTATLLYVFSPAPLFVCKQKNVSSAWTGSFYDLIATCFRDSVVLVSLADFFENQTVIDLGTHAGFLACSSSTNFCDHSLFFTCSEKGAIGLIALKILWAANDGNKFFARHV